MPRKSLNKEPDPIPLYTGDIEADIRKMNQKSAVELGGRLSFPSKMDVAAWGIPATRCKLGAILAQREGSVCNECYALSGTFKFKNVLSLLEENYQKLMNELWTPAMAAQIRWLGEERFRWFMSGDLQSVNHLRNIVQVCLATPNVLHWMPTRERAILMALKEEIPKNLIARLSGTMIDGPVPTGWPYTSTVVSVPDDDTCPSSIEGGSCSDHGCVQCWKKKGNVPYLKH